MGRWTKVRDTSSRSAFAGLVARLLMINAADFRLMPGVHAGMLDAQVRGGLTRLAEDEMRSPRSPRIRGAFEHAGAAGNVSHYGLTRAWPVTGDPIFLERGSLLLLSVSTITPHARAR